MQVAAETESATTPQADSHVPQSPAVSLPACRVALCRHNSIARGGREGGSGEMRNPLLLVTGEILKVTKLNVAVVKSVGCEIKSFSTYTNDGEADPRK